ncbi:MAG: tetratricopeptide repeat protein [Prolixibacteraceae bacterium]
MIIIHKIDELALELFPELKSNTDNKLVVDKLVDFYSFGNIQPKVTIANGFVTVEIDLSSIAEQQTEFIKATRFCEKNQFEQAIPILNVLISKNPSNSEFHRVLGQAYSVIGQNEKAIDCLIDALRWDPKNNYALIMIGNIFAKFKNDISTAKKYYDKVIENDPNDHLAINNLGTNFLQAGKIQEGLAYLEKAYSVNKDYPNTVYGIALANEILGNNIIAFEFGIECIKKCKSNDSAIRQLATELVTKNAKLYLKHFSGEKTFLNYKATVEKLCKRQIKVVEDNSIDTAAKIEYAENYQRDYHLIKYKSSYIGVYHLMMHEVTHLFFATQAREIKENKQFVTNNLQRQTFMQDFSKNIDNLKKSGIANDSAENFFNSIFEGINLQIFNTPIDLFIEDRLYELYPETRPIQFLSLLQIIQEGTKGFTDRTVTKVIPHVIINASKVLNLVNALLFKDLFGFDITSDFKPTASELKQAKDLFQDFYEYRDDKEPGEEYEIIENWGNDLKIRKYYSLVKEVNFDKPLTIEDAIERLETDPLGLDSDIEFKESEMSKFQESQNEIGMNMAVVMFMVDALQYFEKIQTSKIKEIAFQIAMLGTQGISPEKKDYSVSMIKDKTFSGYHLLAYYYISWKLAIPEMLESLKLPFDSEYKLASQMFKGKK